jgi:hypothetical protein
MAVDGTLLPLENLRMSSSLLPSPGSLPILLLAILLLKDISETVLLVIT